MISVTFNKTRLALTLRLFNNLTVYNLVFYKYHLEHLQKAAI